MPSLLQEIQMNEGYKASRFQIGQKYSPIGKNYVCTVVDIHKTFNSKGELVKTRYVSEHDFCGQVVKDYDVVDATIARGKL